MKTQFGQKLATATLAAALMALGSASAADEPKLTTPATDPVPKDSAPPPSNAPVVSVPTPANPEPVKVLQLPKLGLPPLLDQVVKLSQSGTDEAVIRAYVEKAAPAYRVTGNEIVQLRDLGISQGVIMSLIEHSQSANAASVTEAVGPQTPPQPQGPAQTNMQTEVSSAEAATEFYDTLSPYGTWLDVPGYGQCWQPSVVVVNSDWRPYSDGGYWLWSDCGWYWHSYYSWGWAPFHYGRWFCHNNRGWLWCPDRVWGPSWVCWRNSASFCGWAPLPPGSCFTAGFGWSHHGQRVGVDFGFGIPFAHFTFVAHDRFSDRHVGGHSLRGRDAVAAYNNTTVINSYAVGANNRIINNGIGRERIAAASQTPIRNVSVQEMSRSGNNVAMPDRVSRVGNSEVVFRPGAQISTVRAAIARASANQPAHQTVMARSSVASNPVLTQRGPIARTVTPQRIMPNYSQNYVNRGGVIQPNRSVNAVPTFRTSPQYQTFGRSSAPAASAPRSFGSSGGGQRFSAPSAARSFSGGGGAQFRGGGSHGASTVARSAGSRH